MRRASKANHSIHTKHFFVHQITHCWKDYSEKKNDQLTSQIQIMKILC